MRNGRVDSGSTGRAFPGPKKVYLATNISSIDDYINPEVMDSPTCSLAGKFRLDGCDSGLLPTTHPNS